LNFESIIDPIQDGRLDIAQWSELGNESEKEKDMKQWNRNGKRVRRRFEKKSLMVRMVCFNFCWWINRLSMLAILE
jgi:hypothetical protein